MSQTTESKPHLDYRKQDRSATSNDRRSCVPIIVVWETTLACNLKCQTCGSRAGKRRDDELDTQECLDLIDQMAALGTREVSLIGGEAFLRKDWLELVRRIRGHGMFCGMQTGGYNLTPERIRQGAEAGLQRIGVSFDGLEPLHDRLRGVKGSFQHALNALRWAHQAGIVISANTQIGPDVIPQLEEILDLFINEGVKAWQLQLTAAIGNAVDHPEGLLQPHQVLTLMPLIANLINRGKSRGLNVVPSNTVGFFGPYESLFRGTSWNADAHWTSCSAGQNVIGIEADGTIKSCPGLATADFGGGNIRDLTLKDIWDRSDRIHHTRTRGLDSLWGFCGSCYYARVCYAGCTWMSHSLFGLSGNNPYCHHRALELDKYGWRERIVKIRDAANVPFALGEFELVLEPVPGRVAEPLPFVNVPRPGSPSKLFQIGASQTPVPMRPAGSDPPKGRLVPKLKSCPGCHRHVYKKEQTCPHCGRLLDVTVSSPVLVAADSATAM